MYQALYRKWRPKTFAEVVGQEPVTVTLANEVRDGRISHAYLFTGTRGTGKTTCAKIFAKAVNCLNPREGNPCNACAMCMGIDNGSVMDVLELDAASNNGVDAIRALIDETGFTPSQATYRVYIIDEVHMLSSNAGNAFLKTLEEPPEHVIFILATTDAHKLLPTIRSRCQRFDFKRIYADDIVERLLFVAGEEGLTLEREAGVLLARLADGALRDALSLLDLCATGETHITIDVVRRVTGLADKDYLYELADCILEGAIGRALTIIGELHNASCDMDLLCSEFMNHLRSLMVIKALRPKTVAEAPLVCTDEEFARLKTQADSCSLDDILYRLQLLAETAGKLTLGVNKRVEMEVAFVKLSDASLSDSASALKKRISDLEVAFASGEKPRVSPKEVKNSIPQKKEAVFSAESSESTLPDQSPQPSVTNAPSKSEEVREKVSSVVETPQRLPAPDPAPSQPKEETPVVSAPASSWDDEEPEVCSAWPEIVESIKTKSVRLWSFLNETTAVTVGDTLYIKSKISNLDFFLDKPETAEILHAALKTVTGRGYHIKVYKKPPPKTEKPVDLLQQIQDLAAEDSEEE